jgi:hypothetical protein
MATINGTFNSLIGGTISGTVGTPGPQGPAGPAGSQGIPGVGVPVGGTAGQVLAKVDGVSYNTHWIDQSAPDFISSVSAPLAVTSGNLTVNLAGYATETFVTSQGYITSAALVPYLTSATAAATYYPLTNPSGFITSSALSPYLLSSTAAATYQTLAGMSAYAQLSGATFTGNVFAPTPSPGTDSTRIATTEWVKDFDYAQTNSPQFTGNPRSVTPNLSDDDTSIATTAFVKGQNYLTSSALTGYALLSGATFAGKVNFTPVSGVAGLNVGIGGTSAASTTNGDLWISSGGVNLNYRDGTGAWRIVAITTSTNTFSSPQIIDTTSTTTALRVTQKGTGDAIRVEDETTPDATRFTVDQFGKVGIGIAPDATAALKVDTNGIMFGDGTVQTTAASGGGAVAWGSITGTLADQTDLVTELGGKANLSGATFSGAVNAPTSSSVANDTQVINRAFSEQFLGFNWADLVSTKVSNISFSITGTSSEDPMAYDQTINFDFCCPEGFNNIRSLDGTYPIIFFGIFLSGEWQGGWNVTSSSISATGNSRIYNTSFTYGNTYDVYAQVVLNAASPFPYMTSRFKIASFSV